MHRWWSSSTGRSTGPAASPGSSGDSTTSTPSSTTAGATTAHATALPVHDTLDGHVDDLLAVIDGRPAVVVGHSYGGDIALGAALRPGGPGPILAVAAYEPPMPWLGTWATRSQPGAGRSPRRRTTDAGDGRRAVLPADGGRRGVGPAARGDQGGPAGRRAGTGRRAGRHPGRPSRRSTSTKLAVPAVFGRGTESLPHHRDVGRLAGRAHVAGAELVEIAGRRPRGPSDPPRRLRRVRAGGHGPGRHRAASRRIRGRSAVRTATCTSSSPARPASSAPRWSSGLARGDTGHPPGPQRRGGPAPGPIGVTDVAWDPAAGTDRHRRPRSRPVRSTGSSTWPGPGSATSAGAPTRKAESSSTAGPARPDCWPDSIADLAPTSAGPGQRVGRRLLRRPGRRGPDRAVGGRHRLPGRGVRGVGGGHGAGRRCGIRTVVLRTGIVLSATGGALGKQLPLFRLGVGGRIGSGRQYRSWITLDDEVGAILHCLGDATLSGPVNATAPARPPTPSWPGPSARPPPSVLPGRAGRRRSRWPSAPRWPTELILSGQRVVPERLQQSGFTFAPPRPRRGGALGAGPADPDAARLRQGPAVARRGWRTSLSPFPESSLAPATSGDVRQHHHARPPPPRWPPPRPAGATRPCRSRSWNR